MRILVVEDDDALRGLWSDVLHEAGHDVVAVAAFEAARKRWAELRTDPGAVFGVEKRYHGARLTAPFLSANTAATFYALGAVCALAGMLKAMRDAAAGGARRAEALARGLLAPSLAFVLCLTCLVLTASRAGVIAGLAACFAVLIWDAAASRSLRAAGWSRWAPLALPTVWALGSATPRRARADAWTCSPPIGTQFASRRFSVTVPAALNTSTILQRPPTPPP